jgi:hypothetical protein
MIKVEFDGQKATINDGKRKVEEEDDSIEFERCLNVMLRGDVTRGRYGTVDEPDIDHLSAVWMCRRFGGRITDMSEHTSPEDADSVEIDENDPVDVANMKDAEDIPPVCY